jgi:tetratricopeptide (TPR) repeat protein
LRLGTALFLFWEAREHLTEGRRAMDALLGIPDPNPVSKQRARALYTAGVLADIQLDSSSAFELHSASLEIQRQRGDKHGIALALGAIGIVTHKNGRIAEGRSYTEEALLLWKELGSGMFLLGLHNLANNATKQRDYHTARVTYEMTLEAFRSTGDNRGMAVSLNGLGDVAAGQGYHAKARELYSESLKKYREIDDPGGVAAVLRDLGDLACSVGDADACALYKEALCMLHRIGQRRAMAPLLQRLARCAIENGQPDCALTLLAAAAVLREKLGISISTPDGEELDQTLRRARGRLLAIDQDQAWSEGRLMSIDRLVEYALEH